MLLFQMYPAPIRSTAHGISAATGKVGSILVVVWLNYLGNRNKFWITWPFALLGAAICWTFVADNTGLDLAEQVSLLLHQALLCQMILFLSRIQKLRVSLCTHLQQPHVFGMTHHCAHNKARLA